MADIHVLKGAMTTQSKRKVGKQYAFHFPIGVGDQVAAAAQDPALITFVSVVPNIQTVESDAIKAGEVVEKVIALTYNRSTSDPDILVQVRAEYADMESMVAVEYIEKYRQYLTEQTAT